MSVLVVVAGGGGGGGSVRFARYGGGGSEFAHFNGVGTRWRLLTRLVIDVGVAVGEHSLMPAVGGR